MERNVYHEPEDKVLLRTADVYQTAVNDDVDSYSDKLLSIVANFSNSGEPEGYNAQSMVGKSKRGEVACRLFARIDPQTGIIEEAGFKSRGCLAMTGCASILCQMIENMPIEDALQIDIEQIRDAVDGVPPDKVHALYFSVCALKGLIGDFLINEGATSSELDEAIACDQDSISCLMAEHCSFRQSLLEMRMDEIEEMQRIAENNACAECFDLIRKNTLRCKLTTPQDWEGLVPEHLTDYEFSKMIFEHLDEDAADVFTDDLNAEAQKNGDASMSASKSGNGRSDLKKPSRFASRSVGVPNIFGSRKNDAANASVTVARSDPSESPSEENAELDEDPSTGSDPHGSVLDDMNTAYDYSREEQEVDDFELVPPEGYELVEIDGEWGLIKTDKKRKPTLKEIDAHDIKIMQGANDRYLFDCSNMTDSYARWAFLSAEDDPLTTFVYCVREDSKLYPRPMAIVSFTNDPLNLAKDEVEDLWVKSQEVPEFSDINRITASNGDVYFYSDRYLTEEHAKSLAEWSSVERRMNV